MTMIELNEAIELAKEKLDEIEKKSGINLSLMYEETLELEFGWMFFYQSKAFVETGDLGAMVGGNAPMIIDKHNSSVNMTGTRRDENYYIELYRKYRDNIAEFERLL
ncbi:YrhB domain-containing protein [Lewinella sp. LCG006]|uniref:YrhB domain-containing protein n=1 Tax=Lewinella sp. LCG006 TaxID=3231911 RepID=UPI00345F9640